jgi:hypothetical protein
MKNLERRYELTSKFLKMGKALVDEGQTKSDPIISQIGTLLTFIGGLCVDDEDVIKFGELVAMYSAKKILDDLNKSDSGFLSEVFKQKRDVSYDDIIKNVDDLIEDVRNNSDDEESDEEDEEKK